MSSQLKLALFIIVLFAIGPISSGRDVGQTETNLVRTRQESPQSTSRVPATNPDKAEIAPQCETTGTKEITISCIYTPSLEASTLTKSAARIVLNRAEVSFKLNHESYMRVELEFTNEGGSSLASVPTVYLAIDDDTGRNVVRRVLTHVDLARLHTGERLTFVDRLLVGAFTSGRYTISLSIPDSEPSRKNIPAYNMLLSSAGVPDPTTGSNTVAHFSVARSMHSSRDK